MRMMDCKGIFCADREKCNDYEYCVYRDIGKKACWCGICDYILNCPENFNWKKCNLNFAFGESDGEKDLKCEKPYEPCKICPYASWVEKSGVYIYSCRSTFCTLLTDDLPFR